MNKTNANDNPEKEEYLRLWKTWLQRGEEPTTGEKG